MQTCSNITGANHIIFVSPLLTAGQQQYEATWKQCIGRAIRYGQKKKVYIYQFLALRTIDTQIFQERKNQKMVFRSIQKGLPQRFVPVCANQLHAEEKEEEWGIGPFEPQGGRA
jgi:hypothetical protein